MAGGIESAIYSLMIVTWDCSPPRSRWRL